MKKFFTLAAIALIAVAALSSCAKDNTIDATIFDNVESQTEKQVSIFSVDITFDAPETLTQTTIEFYDELGQEVAALSVPVSADTKTLMFASETRPTALYTDGLQNLNEDGVLPLPETSVETKAGKSPVLLVIR